MKIPTSATNKAQKKANESGKTVILAYNMENGRFETFFKPMPAIMKYLPVKEFSKISTLKNPSHTTGAKMISRAKTAVKAPRHTMYGLSASPEIQHSRRPFIRENRGTWEVWYLQRLVKSFPNAIEAALYAEKMLVSSAKRKSAGKRIVHTLKNPSLSHPGREAEAHEIKSAIYSLTGNGPEIAKLVRTASKKKGFSKRKMIAFIQANYAPIAVSKYYRGNRVEIAKYGKPATLKRASEIFVEMALDGEYK